MNRLFPSVCLVVTSAQLALAQSAPSSAIDRTATLRAVPLEGGGVFESAEYLTNPTQTLPDGRTLEKQPPRTVLKLALHPAAGSNIKVELWLPEAANWNGRLLALGNGGSAGRINSGNLAGYCAKGYAAVTTDMGTAPDQYSGVGNREVWKDFGFRATHLMTVVAKQLLTVHYGRGAEFAYFVGGSTGGQQALQEAQRYPEDYDGIVAMVPAHCRTPLHAYFLWNEQVLAACPFTPAQEASVIAAGTEYKAAQAWPVAAGKYVVDPRCTPADIEAVIALALKKDANLTPAHAEALRKLFGGPRHAVTGERIFGGIPFGSSLQQARNHLYLFHWVFGKERSLHEVNFGADLDTYTAALAPYLNAENPDLTAFQKRGGKLLMTSGTADSIVPYHATLDYYERVAERMGGIENVRRFFRYYLIPGMAHSNGPGLNQPPGLLEPLRAWREQGTVPAALPARHAVNGKVEYEVPLYPYPQTTVWDPTTSSYQAAESSRGGVERVAERFRPPAAE